MLATGLAAAGTEALAFQDWRPLWLVPTGPFACLLPEWHEVGGPDWSWSHENGAWFLAIAPWAFGGLVLAIAAQWLVPPKTTALSMTRIACWAVGWTTWFSCGFLSGLWNYG